VVQVQYGIEFESPELQVNFFGVNEVTEKKLMQANRSLSTVHCNVVSETREIVPS
jgi:hypothetical protein